MAARKNNRSGFTMLEILLVTVLLFSLSYAVYLSVKKNHVGQRQRGSKL